MSDEVADFLGLAGSVAVPEGLRELPWSEIREIARRGRTEREEPQGEPGTCLRQGGGTGPSLHRSIDAYTHSDAVG